MQKDQRRRQKDPNKRDNSAKDDSKRKKFVKEPREKRSRQKA